MAILVTGASGHVGREIVRRAAERELEIVALYRSGAPATEAHGLGGKATWVQCALDDEVALKRLVATHRIEACIHAAAVSNEAYARPNPVAAVATNIGATARLLDAVRMAGWRRFILVSTGSVFQMREDTATPILEDAPVQPGNVYGTTKTGAELITRMYRRELGVSAASVRISWVYGPPVMSDSPTRGPIPSFLMRALRGEAIREDGGDFAASFTYVTDVADGLLAAALAPAVGHDTYHLGPGVNFTARDVAEAVRRTCDGATIELGSGTEPWTRYTAMRAPLAGSRLRDDTGFSPTHSLDEGIRLYAEWMRRTMGR